MRKISGWLMILAMSLPGCDQFLAQRMVAPPNEHRVHTAATTQTADGMRELRIAVGPPDATLAAWVVEPDTKSLVTEGTGGKDAKGEKSAADIRGTVLVLHGFHNSHFQLEGAAKALSDEGYRAVLVDLRGHGQSTGEYISYGVQDAQDLATVTTYLQRHDLCGATIGVFGVSYGATSALLFAGADPRVTAVVAVAPFTTLRQEAPHFGRSLIPVPGLFLSDADYTAIITDAGKIAGFDPDACNTLDAIRKTKAHIHLFHGDLDAIIPTIDSKELQAADPERSELTIMHGLGHLALCFDPFGVLQKPTRQWFDRYLAAPSAVAAR